MAGPPRDFREARGSAGAALERVLQRGDANIIGGGFGRRTQSGVRLTTPACVVYVVRKLPAEALPRERLLPRTTEVDGVTVEVDVVETGPFHALSYTGRVRPAKGGCSIGNIKTASSGTLGCLVHDRQNNNRLSILSNNHVLARSNSAAIGEQIVQPGRHDDDTDVADNVIGTLVRYVPINFSGGNNYVDAAIAQVAKADVVHKVMGSVITQPTPAQQAIGLLFAGGGTRTLLNPISHVLTRLNVSMYEQSAWQDVTGSQDPFRIRVGKVGRTTEGTTRFLKEIDVTVTIDYGGGRRAKFVDQLAADAMSCPGDSGSVVCRLPAGSDIGHPPCLEPAACAFLTAAEDLTGIPFKQEGETIRMARDQYLATTPLGRWLVDMVYVNQQALFDRGENTQVTDGDRALAQAMYTKYLGEVKLALADPTRDDLRLTQAHLADVRTALDGARKYLTPEESGAADWLYGVVQGQVGKKPSELIAMLNDPVLYETVRTLFGDVTYLIDPYE
ncbi:hypothetical protein [Nonomuraea sp. NPDC050643]|uniref:hypothetical protein n=1 Tax=Nonomuraea sp. NPDC050643 TaxID=3155660 RepID=UPI0033C2CA72